MSIRENIISVALRLTGGGSFVTLSRSAEELRGKLDRLPAALVAGDISADQFARTSVKLAGELGRQEKFLAAFAAAEGLQAAAADKATAAIANQAITASAWGAVMASAAEKSRAAAEAIRDKAAADARAVASANDLLGRLTLSTQAVEADRRATVENASAKRQQATAADGTAREIAHLNSVIKAGQADHASAIASNVQYASASDNVKTSLATMRTQLDAAKAELKQVAIAFAQGRLDADAYRAATQRISSTITTLDSASAAIKGTASNMAGLGQAGLQTGRILQDFSQGGIGGIINNLEGFAMAAGLGAGAAGALTMVGVAALVATPHVKAWWQEMTAGNIEIPKASDGLKRLDGEMAKVSEKLDAYREKQKLTNIELADYNKLAVEQADLEKQKNDESERRQALKAIEGGVSKDRQERASGFRDAIAEVDDPTAKLRQAIENLNPEMGRAEAQKKADDLMIEGSKGFKDAIDEVRKTIRIGLPEKDQKLADEIQSRTPEAVKGAKAGEERQEREEKAAAKAIKDDEEFWAAVRDDEKAAAAELGKQVNGLIDDVGEELKTIAEAAAREGKDKAGVAAAVLPAAARGAAEAGHEGDDAKEIAAATADKVADDATNSKARARRNREAETAGARDTKAGDKQANALAAHLAKTTDVDEQAAAAVASVRNQGGATNPETGQFHPMTPEQQQQFIRKEIFAYLRRIRVSGQNAQLASGPLTAKAFGQEDDAELARAAPQPPKGRAAPPPRKPPATPRGGPEPKANRKLRVLLPPGLGGGPAAPARPRLGVTRRVGPTRRKPHGPTTSHTRRGPTPALKPGSRSLAGPGATRTARGAERDAGIKATNDRVAKQVARNTRAVAAAKKEQDALQKTRVGKTMGAVGAAKKEQDRLTRQRRAKTRAAINQYDGVPGPPRGGRPGAPPASPVAPVQDGQAQLQGAMAVGQQALAQTIQNQAMLNQRTKALENQYRQLARGAEGVGRTNQSMST